MRSLILSGALAAALAAGSWSAPVEAAQPPRVKPMKCSSAAASVGAANVWRTFFRGEKEGLFDDVWHYQLAPCFTSQANCKAWLYWAMSDWPKRQWFKPCYRGSS